MTGIPGVSGLSTMFVAKSSVALNLVLIGIVVLMMVSKGAEIRGLHKQIDDPKTGLKVQLADTQNTLGICRANVATMRTSLDRQNAAVDALARAGVERDQLGAAALANARKNNQPLTVKVQEIQTTKASGDLCKSADDLIKGAVK